MKIFVLLENRLLTFNNRYIESNIAVKIKLANPNLHISFCYVKSFDFRIIQFILCENKTEWFLGVCKAYFACQT